MDTAPHTSLLSHAESLRLLGTVTAGRVVHTDRALPAVTTVAFVLWDGAVVFRAEAFSRLAALADQEVVAFQADEVHSLSHAGWSVVVTGRARRVQDAARLVELTGGQVPAPVTPDEVWFRIDPGLIEGSTLPAAS